MESKTLHLTNMYVFPLKPIVSVLLLVASAANAQLINGDFQTGDFTGWTLFDVPGGASSLTQVTLFDTAATGVSSMAAQFEVGEVGYPTFGGPGSGAGIFQDVMLNAGQMKIQMDIAAQSLSNDEDCGTFEILVDGTAVSGYAFGGMGPGQTTRDTLSYSGAIDAGMHQIGVEMIRGFNSAPAITPYQYIDNIQLSIEPVPEPSVIHFFAIGLVVFASYRVTKVIVPPHGFATR